MDMKPADEEGKFVSTYIGKMDYYREDGTYIYGHKGYGPAGFLTKKKEDPVGITPQMRLEEYSLVLEKARNFRIISITPEELKEAIFKQASDKYDRFIKNVIEYKSIFIQKYMNIIYPEDNSTKKDLDQIIAQIEEVQEKLRVLIAEKEVNLNIKEEMDILESAEMFSGYIDDLEEENTLLKEYSKTQIVYKFEESTVDSMFGLEKSKSTESRFVPQLPNKEGVVRVFDLFQRKAKNISINIEGFPIDGATCALRDSIYVGGSNQNTETDTYFYEVDGIHLTFKKLKRMIDRRSHFSLVATSPCELYAVGGSDYPQKFGSYYLAKCEKYRIKEDKWVALPPLNQGRFRHGSCFFPNTKEVYAFGGYMATSGAPIHSIEKIPTKHPQQWEVVNLQASAGWAPTYDIICKSISSTQILIAGRANFMFDVKGETMKGIDKPPQTGSLPNYSVSPTTYKGRVYIFNSDRPNAILEYVIKQNIWNTINC